MKEPKCPYCGTEMICRLTNYLSERIKGWNECSKCGSRSPVIEMYGKAPVVHEAVRVAAMCRYEPPLKPLEFDKAFNADFCYLENKGMCADWCDVVRFGNTYGSAFKDREFVELLEFGVDSEGEKVGRIADYGKTWRCWSRQPSEDERKGAGWKE